MWKIPNHLEIGTKIIYRINQLVIIANAIHSSEIAKSLTATIFEAVNRDLKILQQRKKIIVPDISKYGQSF